MTLSIVPVVSFNWCDGSREPGRKERDSSSERDALRTVLAAFVKAHPGGKDPSARDSAEDVEKGRPHMSPQGGSKPGVAGVLHRLQQK